MSSESLSCVQCNSWERSCVNSTASECPSHASTSCVSSSASSSPGEPGCACPSRLWGLHREGAGDDVQAGKKGRDGDMLSKERGNHKGDSQEKQRTAETSRSQTRTRGQSTWETLVFWTLMPRSQSFILDACTWMWEARAALKLPGRFALEAFILPFPSPFISPSWFLPSWIKHTFLRSRPPHRAFGA